MRGSFSEQQQADLALYFRELSQDSERLISLWLEAFIACAPRRATEPERSLFLSNLKVLLTLAHAQVSTQPSYSSAQDSLWKKALQIVHEKYSDPNFSEKTVSTALQLSKRKVGALFKTHTGQRFREYLRDARIQHGARLLLTSTDGIKQIAAMVGYADQSHFVRNFRKQMGCTPAEYRKQECKPPLPAMIPRFSY